MSVPFAWPAMYLLRYQDAIERADRLIAVWPVLLIVVFVIAVSSIKRRTGIVLVLPFILLAAVNGNFMSQQLWGSTYAVWPLFMILFASAIAGLASLLKSWSSWTTIPLVAIVTASLLISGAPYVPAHERLDYAN